ncbi:putative thymidylate synthase [Flavobacterium phage Fpv1]|uniref:Putative thymidylate synthase n=2 Tax=Fipvunavirus Fpv1 TaxID=2560475 RepID=A0A1B0WKS5_9CAUD|nr:putative thymidylate synthase [Flavobacterium phage Fpv20]YP_009322043.1 putative thymidylate synthase [Flavobacterium phage Fpv1]YP_009323632.1 putative thymidylate synthase [Flavobacterium phage Fpv2]ALN97286.1 putative thymidylate synthase complementing protein [Flavobacterium phage FpV21]QCW20302.1 hypothetical protein [Flavobacterium phage FPSV-F12]ANB40283.1 putative thymidylate synthase [Flavobacterium phage Fpv1]ANB40363.1 putative thymidylate synthase [Flavobacterium phage Fpv2]A
MSKISAEIVADSISPQGERLTSFLITFPRIILSEINTHRMLSKNTSSSRAIPFSKLLEMIERNPFVPIGWQKDHKGMQGTEYWEGEHEILDLQESWFIARDRAVEGAKDLDKNKVTKQLCNRLLEPFMWTTMLITGPKSGWDNFFYLRCPQYYFEPENKSYRSKKEWVAAWNGTFETGKDVTRPVEVNDWNDLFWLKQNTGQAEIHMMALAECIWDAYNESTPKQLKAGEWHIPFIDRFESYSDINADDIDKLVKDFELNDIKISVAMAARTSYTVVGEEKELNYENLIALHDRLLNQHPPHSSPFEHTARAMSDEEYYTAVKTVQGLNREKAITRRDLGWCNNLKGFIQYRYIVDNSLSL